MQTDDCAEKRIFYEKSFIRAESVWLLEKIHVQMEIICYRENQICAYFDLIVNKCAFLDCTSEYAAGKKKVSFSFSADDNFRIR